MSEREWQIGICGTFDVENYGDLLFPLIAEAELRQRFGSVKLHRFSYYPKSVDGWPYAVRSLVELPMAAGQLDGLIIGGGDLIRFDKRVAPGYGPPPGIHHPTGYWLAPMLIASQHGCPVVWNAPGAHADIPTWAEPLLELVINLSSYVAVRDVASHQALSRWSGNAEIKIVPDTAFGVAKLVNVERPSVEYVRLCETLGLKAPYIVVQAISGLDAFFRCVRHHPEIFRDYQLLILPVGPILGDDPAVAGDNLPGSIRITTWPRPLLITELIAHAAAAVGISLHLALTALVFGVPVFRPAEFFGGKFASLRSFDTIVPFDIRTEIDAQVFVAKLGSAEPSPAALLATSRLSAHWDHVASIFASHRSPAPPEALGRFWQSMPGWLETCSVRAAAALAERDALMNERDSLLAERDALVVRAADARTERDALLAEHDALVLHRALALAERRALLNERDALLTERAALLAQRDVLAARNAAVLKERDQLLDSTSWKITGPMRALGRRLGSRRTWRIKHD